jgi:hypothetical protein
VALRAAAVDSTLKVGGSFHQYFTPMTYPIILSALPTVGARQVRALHSPLDPLTAFPQEVPTLAPAVEVTSLLTGHALSSIHAHRTAVGTHGLGSHQLADVDFVGATGSGEARGTLTVVPASPNLVHAPPVGVVAGASATHSRPAVVNGQLAELPLKAGRASAVELVEAVLALGPIKAGTGLPTHLIGVATVGAEVLLS